MVLCKRTNIWGSVGMFPQENLGFICRGVQVDENDSSKMILRRVFVYGTDFH